MIGKYLWVDPPYLLANTPEVTMRTLILSYSIVFSFILATDSALAAPEEIPHTPTLQEWRQQ